MWLAPIQAHSKSAQCKPLYQQCISISVALFLDMPLARGLLASISRYTLSVPLDGPRWFGVCSWPHVDVVLWHRDI